jgi:hypothetical protein
MKSTTSRWVSVLTLFLMTSSSGCAPLLALSATPPAPNNRKWRFALDRPALVYDYHVCVKKVLWNCTRTELKQESWDLTDPAVRQRVVDMDMVALVRERPVK